MKKVYLAPTMTMVRLQHKGLLMQSPCSTIKGNVGFNYGGGGSGSARTREQDNIWDDEDW
ncbi:MAG: hypothetical protein IK144_04790 [Bacteroidaceae bacterium]|nr:hypothetical protein [Bacteroidaceae bacterium]